MNSSNIKNLLLILLFAVNAFLLVNLVTTGSSNQNLSEEVIESAVSALAKKDVYVSADQIPSKAHTQSIIGVDCSVQSRVLSAEKFIGEIIAEYNLPNGITYQSENAYVTFFDGGNFEYGLIENRGDKKTPSESEVYVTELSGNTKKMLKKAFSRMISESENKKMFSLREIGQSESENSVTVYADLMIDGLKPDNSLMTFVFENGKLVYVSGKYIFDTFTEFYPKEYIDAASALFLIEHAVLVEKIQMIYYPVMSDTDYYYFVPSWCITDSDDNVYIYDAVSGYERK